jgi:hypothetical protein
MESTLHYRTAGLIGCKRLWLGSDPGMARQVCGGTPPPSKALRVSFGNGQPATTALAVRTKALAEGRSLKDGDPVRIRWLARRADPSCASILWPINLSGIRTPALLTTPGIQTGSQRPESLGHARPFPAIATATKRHVRPYPAPPEHVRKCLLSRSRVRVAVGAQVRGLWGHRTARRGA